MIGRSVNFFFLSFKFGVARLIVSQKRMIQNFTAILLIFVLALVQYFNIIISLKSVQADPSGRAV